VYQVVLGVLGLAMAAANIAFWWYVVRHGDLRFRLWVERRFDVVITTGLRGHWRALGEGSKLRLIAIEFLQLAYFMTAFSAWAVMLLICVGLMTLLEASLAGP
jgi:hypothetical protein